MGSAIQKTSWRLSFRSDDVLLKLKTQNEREFIISL